MRWLTILAVVAVVACGAFAGVGSAVRQSGGTIAFESLRGHRLEISVVNGDGSGLRQLTTLGSALSPNWSPDGRKITFVGGASPGAKTLQVYVMNAESRGVKQLTKLTGSGARLPAWSPTGREIALSTANGSLYVMNSDGSGLRLRATRTRGFAWAPDGTSIAFASDKPVGIFVVGAGGGKPRLVLKKAVVTLAWSGGSKRIVFGTPFPPFFATPAHPHGILPEIDEINVDGSGLTRLAPVGEFPAVSADGRKIAYDDAHGTIDVMNADGSGKRALVREPGALLGSLGWSPDAARLAFVTATPTGKSRLYVVGSSGGKARLLSEAVLLATFAWQP